MKKTLTISMVTLSALTMAASPQTAFADEANSIIKSGFSSVNSQHAKNLEDCFTSDIDIASSRAIRACSKSYKNSIPNAKTRSTILTRRGLLQLSAGNFEKASRDFKAASKLSRVNELSHLGEAYAAVMRKDLKTAEGLFNDCLTHGKTKPLAVYGLGIIREMSGDNNGAVSAYEQAASLRPNWQAPREDINRLVNL